MGIETVNSNNHLDVMYINLYEYFEHMEFYKVL